jgi:hypothetical protein
VEEYAVSMDGVRQDFVVTDKPAGVGELELRLEVAGARVEEMVGGARLVLEESGRKIAYSRLRAVDAAGKELAAWLEMLSTERLEVRVEDAGAVYPVRIDPTFSDANWVSMGDVPGTDGYVEAAVTDGLGNLYVGGTFTVAGNVIANNVAEWNGSSWSALGSGMNNQVSALAVSGTNLYAGGDFTMATNSGGATVNVNYVARWNGSSWSALGSGMGGEVLALAVSGTNLYAGGWFTTATNSGGAAVAVNYVAQWNGSSWSALGSGMDSYVFALAVSGTNLYAGGIFTMAGGKTANSIAQWNGSSWSALGSGMNNDVEALAVSGTNLYAGGWFATAGGVSANYIAQWNGSSWSALSSGMNGNVHALAVSGNTLYAGGEFTRAGAIGADSIAQWNGSSWSALGSGMNSWVEALAVSGNTLYAGGDFTMAGGISAKYIAQWNGSSWTALGSGINNSVLALAVSGTNLYAGGSFTTAGGTNANYIAQWNGSSWSALGSGMDSYVYALAVSGGTLYAGGYFTMATNSGGVAVPANYIAQWNGSSWSALGAGVNNFVYALAVSGTNLYAGGAFTTAGGISANNIGQWKGSSWSALGSGMNHVVYTLAVLGNVLYAGGEFTTAGGKISAYAAEAVLVLPTFQGVPVHNTSGSITLNVSSATNSQSRLYAATNLSPPVLWQPICTNLNGGLWQFTDTNTAPFRTKFYRLSTP